MVEEGVGLEKEGLDDCCPLCGEKLEDGDLVWADVQKGRCSYVIHYTREHGDHDIIALCQTTVNHEQTTDIYTIYEAMFIGIYLTRAALDAIENSVEVTEGD